MTSSKNIITSWELANDPSTEIFSDVEQELICELSKRIEEELDDQVMGTMLEATGWIKVKTNVLVPQEWLAENIKGECRKLYLGWYFADEQDAEWFILRWL